MGRERTRQPQEVSSVEEAQRGALFVSNGTEVTMCVAKGGQRHRTSFENEEAIDRLKILSHGMRRRISGHKDVEEQYPTYRLMET